MNLNIIAYLVYFSITGIIIVKVGRICYNNGNIFVSQLIPNHEDLCHKINQHEKNINNLIQTINDDYPCAVASLVCYACIETNPAISEIRIDVQIDSNNYFVVIDLFTPEDDVISFSNMH